MQKLVGYVLFFTLCGLVLVGIVEMVANLLPYLAVGFAVILPLYGSVRKLGWIKTSVGMKTLTPKRRLRVTPPRIYVTGFVLGFTYHQVAISLVRGIGVLIISLIAFGILWELARAIIKAVLKYEILSYAQALSGAI